MNTKVLLVSAAVLAMSAIGCAKKTVAPPPPPPEPAPAEPAPEPKTIKAPTMKTAQHVKITDDHLEVDQKIHFGTDSDTIESDSFGLLDEIAGVLKEHGEIAVIHVVGHTDVKGDDKHNMELSERRAASVVKALRDRGIEQQIDSRGAGETELACKEDTDECHEKNRRVEFIVEA